MKKFALILMTLVVGSTLLFTGCQDPDPVEVKPTISFETGADFTSTDVTVEANTQLLFGINADANENSGSALAKLTLVRHFVNLTQDQTIEWDTVINVNTFSINFEVSAYPVEGTETFIFTITDADGETAEVSLDVTTEITYAPINVWENIKLGDQDNTIGSSFASIDGTTYTLAEASENSNKIDFVYYYGATNRATICSPSDETAVQVYSSIENWETRNGTTFKETTVTPEEFDAIPADNDTQVIELATGADLPKINRLDDDVAAEVLGFITEEGKMGLIKIEEIKVGSGLGTPGHIIITVKVQQ